MGRKSGSRVSVTSSQLQSRPGSSCIRRTRTRKNEVSSLVDCHWRIHQLSRHGDVDGHVDGDVDIVPGGSKGREKPKRQKKDWSNRLGAWFRNETVLRIIIGLIMSGGYFLFISRHFETLTSFSTLTNLEKELSLPTDTAFRYSFFKRIGEEDSLLTGIRSVIYDNRSDYNPKTLIRTNSVQKYGLISEILFATTFHVVKRVVGPRCWNGPSSSVLWSEQICSGLGDPLTFWLTFSWILDSIVVLLVIIAGSRLSGSKLGGILSGFTFGLNHPQILDWTTIFPTGDSLGLLLASGHTFLIADLVIKPIHTSWTTVVKLSLVTAGLVILWPMEAQWVLFAQLVSVLALTFSHELSPYLVFVVVGSHVVGWEYASLVVIDLSLKCWTFYLYLLLGGVGVIYGVRRVIDHLLGSKLEKKLLLRATILGVGLYLFMTEARHGMHYFSTFQEDLRMSRHFHQYKNNQTGVKSEIKSWPGGASATAISGDYNKPEEDSLEFNFLEENADLPWLLSVNHDHNPQGGLSSLSEREKESGESIATGTSQEISELNNYPWDGVGEGQTTKQDITFTTVFKEVDVTISSDNDRNMNDSSTHPHLNSNELNDYLLQCLISSSSMKPLPLGKLTQHLQNHITPIAIALAALVFFNREERKLMNLGGDSTFFNNAKLSPCVHFHAVCSLTFLAISVLVHEKFGILFVAQLSLLVSLFMVQLDDGESSVEIEIDLSPAPETEAMMMMMRGPSSSGWKIGNSIWTGFSRLKHFSMSRYAIAILGMMIMMISTKMKTDFGQEPNQQFLEGDPNLAAGKEELVQVMKWIREESPNPATFLGPFTLMTNVYSVGGNGVGVANHKNIHLPHWQPPSQELFQLFDTHLPLSKLCENLNSTTMIHPHLLLSREFCLNPSYPHLLSSLDGKKEVNVKVSEVKGTTSTNQIPGMKVPSKSKPHRQPDQSQSEVRLRNGVVSDILSDFSFVPVDNPSCNLVKFWDKIHKDSKKIAATKDQNEKENGHTPCLRLFSLSSETEIKPFRRVFHNRLYSVVTCS